MKRLFAISATNVTTGRQKTLSDLLLQTHTSATARAGVGLMVLTNSQRSSGIQVYIHWLD